MSTSERWTLIGDIVGSRAVVDRAALHSRVSEVLARVSVELGSVQTIEPTLGDEFQGVFASLQQATLASLLIRLELLPHVDTRYGIGAGQLSVYDDSRTPLLQDGPAWWSAREAIERLSGRGMRQRRCWYVAGQLEQQTPDEPFVNAFLTCRDQLVDRLGDRGRAMLLDSLRGASQQALSREFGVSPSAVSQQFTRGIRAVRDAQVLLETRSQA